jgi:hypothetical protein
MKINIKRTGGYAGLEEELAAVDTSRLEPGAAQRVEGLTSSMGFFDLPAVAEDDAVGADMFRYNITVSDGGREHTVSFGEESPSAAPLRDLIEELKQLS